MRLYHFCEARHAWRNIARRRIKIATLSELNDPFEFFGVDLRDKTQRQLFKLTKKLAARQFGLLCFSRRWHNPLLWSHYADKHRGVCLGFDVVYDGLVRVSYVRDRLTDPFRGVPVSRLSEAMPQEQLEGLIRRVLSTKFRDWRYEQEQRLFVNLDSTTRTKTGLYFYDLSPQVQLREIILGSRCGASVDRVRAFVGKGAPSVSVVKARLAFGSFSVVPDGRAAKRT
jgi:hypothetical protein